MKQFSSIQQLMQHSQALGIEQHHLLTFKIKQIEYRLSDGKCYYIVQLHNSEYFFKTFFREFAAELLYQQENDEATQHVSILQSVIDISKWRFVKVGKFKIGKNQRKSLEILDFSFSGEDRQIYNLQELDLNNYQQQDSQNTTYCSQIIEEEHLIDKKIKIENDQVTISELYPELRQWTLIGRIIQKSPLQEMKSKFNNRMRQHFYIAILDANQDIIFGLFGDEVCSTFYNVLQLGKIYNFSTAKIEKIESQNSQSNIQNQYRLIFFKFSEIEESNIILPLHKQIKQLNTIQNLKKLETVQTTDILAYVLDAQANEQRINLQLTDQTDSIGLTVWKNAYNANIQKGMVIAIYNAMVCNANLRLQKFSVILTEYQDPKADKLLQWGREHSLRQVQGQYQNLLQINSQLAHIFNNNTQQFVKTLATIKNISKATTYLSCSSVHCKKKVELVDNIYHCPRCQENILSPIPQFRFEVVLSDRVLDVLVVMFDQVCQALLKFCADYFCKLDENEKQDKLLEIEGREYEFNLLLRMNQSQFPQIIVQSISKPTYINAVRQSLKELIDQIMEIN